ncbi:hypothetical protein WICPIJ_001900 [Wickerhamomyces pijperi]|uniref:Uncharacterized protein n=1 Tax=Wickerhamomyces pijperi TaxID=599730 RepID=A0A9P8QCS5_WICPI|nr:hypothetical protein WICPIJ_001900 [Wickerhamomyces pijperi]
MPHLWTSQTDPNSYPTPPTPPKLTPQLCLTSQSTVREFLNMSRHYTDDVLKQRLNSRLNEDRSTSSTDGSVEVCKDLLNQYRSVWEQRANVINYCQTQSAEYRSNLLAGSDNDSKVITNEELRHNPYALKDLQDQQDRKQEQLQMLENWVNNELFIEKIVIKKSLDVFKRTCGGDCF